MRSEILAFVEDARTEIERETGMPTSPPAELLVVDRKLWAAGNVRTFRRLFDGVELSGSEAKVLAIEGGAFLGVLARAVLAQFDPFRDQLLVVHPNLGNMADTDGLRWLMLHEVTHLAQFRAAPWIPGHIVELGRSVLATQRGLARQVATEIRERLPEIVGWARDVLEGRSEGLPLLDLLPQAQREAIAHLYSLGTVLEGHATLVTELIGRRTMPGYQELQARLKARGRRPALVRLLEAVAGLEMKRKQYELGRSFCGAVWDRGGASALAPAWAGPETIPSTEELRRPELWLARVA